MIPEGETELKLNEYSWNKLGNMLYIESPAGVGFSYIDSESEEELYVDDQTVAQDNLEAVLNFFVKFPQFKKNDFYISGESYAGIYIPMLANKILEYNEKQVESDKIRLKGFLVGNGVADWNYDTSPAVYDFAFTHHLISYEMRAQFNKVCITEPDEAECNKIKEEIDTKNLADLNMYDLLRDCYFPPEGTPKETYKDSFYYQYARWAFPQLKKKFGQTKKRNFLSFIEENKKEISLAPPCVDVTNIETYFNRADVQSALHVKSRKWGLCDDAVGSRYKILPEGSIYLYPKLIKSGLKIVIFSGDTDMAVPFNGNQKWIDNLKMEIVSPWRSWRADNDAENVAGYRVIYDGLTFVTFKGVGHMAVAWHARDAYYMLKQYLADKDL